MGGRGATARHAAREPEPPPDGAAITARQHRIASQTEGVLRRLKRHEQATAVILDGIGALAAGCPDADLLAAALDKLSARHALSCIEMISLAAHFAESREACELQADLLRKLLEKDLLGDARFEAGVTKGYERRVAEEQQEAAQRARTPRARHARPKLTVVKGAAAAAGIIGLASAGGAAALHDSASSVTYVASGPAHRSVLHFSAPDPSAQPLRPSWSPSARPSVAVKSASPAPSVTPSPAGSSPASAPSPSSSAPVSPDPGLLVSVRDLDLDGPTGTFTLTATGDAVNWSVVTDIPGASIDVRQGVLSSAQEPVTITLTDPLGESGTVFIRYGDQGIATIWVTPAPLP